MVQVAAFVAACFTPTSLFVLLNIVIATIFFTSTFGNHNHQENTTSARPPQLFRAPSLFSRVTSFNFSYNHHHSDDQPHEPAAHHLGPDYQNRPNFFPTTPPSFSRSPSLLSRVTSFNFYRAQAQPDPAHTVTVPAQEEPSAAHESRRPNKTETEIKIVDGLSREEASGKSRDEGKKVATEKKKEEDKAVGGGGNERESEVHKKAVRQRKLGGAKKKGEGALVGKTAPFRRAHDEEEVDAKADDFINKFKQQLKMQRLESLLRYRSPAT